MPHSDINIEFYILVGDDKPPITEFLKNPESLLNYYLSEEDVTDSTFQGGYCISIDGKKWNAVDDEFYFDMYAFSINWLQGLQRLLLKEVTVANVGFWEESDATATLVNVDTLEILDKTASGRIIAPAVQVDFRKFCEEMVNASKQYVTLASDIKDLVESKGNRLDQKKGERIVKEMCGEEFAENYDSIQRLNRKTQ